MAPALRELPTVRVDRELAVEGDAATAVEPVVGLTETAEPEALEPRDGVEGEAVVDERQVHLGRPHVGPRPEVRGLADDLGLVRQGVLVPRHPLEDLRADRLNAHCGVGEVVRDGRRRDDDGDGPVAGHVAVVQPERRGDGSRREVVVHRHRVPVDGVGVEPGVPPPVDRNHPEHFAGSAVTMHVLRGVQGDPIGGGHGAEGSAPFAERSRDTLGVPAVPDPRSPQQPARPEQRARRRWIPRRSGSTGRDGRAPRPRPWRPQ